MELIEENAPYHLLNTAAGLEDIVEMELAEETDNYLLHSFPYLGGHRLVSLASFEQLRTLRSIQMITRIYRTFTFDHTMGTIRSVMNSVDFPELEQAETFRISTRQFGRKHHKAQAIQSVAGEVIRNRYGLQVDLKHYDVNVRLDFVGNIGYTGIQKTADKFDHRHSRGFYHNAGVRTSTAYAMLRLADPQPGQTLLDPFTGGGTTVLEAASLYGDDITILAGDWNEDILGYAKQNAEEAGLSSFISYFHLDARKLEESIEEPVDLIVTNPPYGFKSGMQTNIRQLYTHFLESAARVLKPLGKIVLISERGSLIRHILYEQKKFAIEHERLVSGGGLKPHIMVLRLIDFE